MPRRLSLLVFLLTCINAVRAGWLDISGYTNGPIQLGKVTIPEPQKAAYDFTGSIDQVQIYGCSKARTKNLKRALKSASQSAAAVRDLLANPTADLQSFALMDDIFGNAFSLSPSGDANRQFVRNVFDSISQGVTIHSANPLAKSSNRIVCLTKKNYGDVQMTGSAIHNFAIVVFADPFWKSARSWEFSPCGLLPDIGPGGLPQFKRTYAFTVLHEFAHLAGVFLTEPERYDPHEFMTLSAKDAMQNAQNYAYAATLLKHGCAKKMIQLPDNKQPPHWGEMRKLLNATDGVPPNSTFNFTGVQLPSLNDTIDQIPTAS